MTKVFPLPLPLYPCSFLLAGDAQVLARFDLVGVVADHVLVGLVDLAPGDAVPLADLGERVAALDGVGRPAPLAAAAADFEVHDEVARAHVRVDAVVLVPDFLLDTLA